LKERLTGLGGATMRHAGRGRRDHEVEDPSGDLLGVVSMRSLRSGSTETPLWNWMYFDR
jgi:hypothetical protein